LAVVEAEHPGWAVEHLGVGDVLEIEDLAAAGRGIGQHRVLARAEHGDPSALRACRDSGEHLSAVFVAEAVAELVEDEHPGSGVRCREEGGEDEVHGEELLLCGVGPGVVTGVRATMYPLPVRHHLPLPVLSGRERSYCVDLQSCTVEPGFASHSVE